MSRGLIKGQSDFFFGLLLASISVVFLVLLDGLESGTSASMGPGYFPRGVTFLLLALSVFLMSKGILSNGDKVVGFQLMPLAFVSASLLAFALLIDRAGLVVALLVMVAIASFGSRERTFVQSMMFGLALTIASCFIFVWGLSVPMKVFP